MLNYKRLLLLGAFFCGCSSAFYGANGRCGFQNGGAHCDPSQGGICCSISGFCGSTNEYCLVAEGCQLNCTGEPIAPTGPNQPLYAAPAVKLTKRELEGILTGVAVFILFVTVIIIWLVPLKTLQIVRRPVDLFNLYGPSGFVLFLFGNRTTWRTEAYVLGKLNDANALNFKKSVQDECTMISVAAAIVAQISVTALSLNYLSQTHWIARAFLVFSIISSLMAVYYATTQQRTMGRLLQPNQVRGWIRGQLPPQRLNSISKSQPATRPQSDPEQYQPLESASTSASDDLMKSCFTPSVASVVTLSAPQILLSTSLFTLIIGIGVYFGFIWTHHIDIQAQKGDSRNVFSMFLASTIICVMVYSLSGLIQDNDTSTEKMILLDYVYDYLRENPGLASQSGFRESILPDSKAT